MTATTLTLTDFLLARIQEDAVNATLGEIHLGDCDSVPASGDEYTYPCDCGYSVRVLAECEAKRRIVNEWQTFGRVAAERDGQPLPQVLTSAGITTGLERAVRTLAAIYADHPDYCDEWRP